MNIDHKEAIYDLFQPGRSTTMEHIEAGDLFYTNSGTALYMMTYLGFGVKMGGNGASFRLRGKEKNQYFFAELKPKKHVIEFGTKRELDEDYIVVTCVKEERKYAGVGQSVYHRNFRAGHPSYAVEGFKTLEEAERQAKSEGIKPCVSEGGLVGCPVIFKAIKVAKVVKVERAVVEVKDYP